MTQSQGDEKQSVAACRGMDSLGDCSGHARRFGFSGGATALRGDLPIEQGRGMLDEHDIVLAWRKLFHGSTITDKTVGTAETLLKQL